MIGPNYQGQVRSCTCRRRTDRSPPSSAASSSSSSAWARGRFQKVRATCRALPAAVLYVLIAYPRFAQLIAKPNFKTLLIARVPLNILIGFISGAMPAAWPSST
jgi:hypothetical protein